MATDAGSELCTEALPLRAILVIDHVTKLVFGWAPGPSADSGLALRAWKRATAGLHRLGISPAGIIVHHDQDPVFTSYEWTRQLLLRDGARISYALCGAKDTPEMEAFNARFKCENRSADERPVAVGARGDRRDRMNHSNRREEVLSPGEPDPARRWPSSGSSWGPPPGDTSPA